MTKHCLLLILVFAISNHCFSQHDINNLFSKRNALYIEVGGNAGYYSLNYDIIFFQKGNFKLDWRNGFSLLPIINLPIFIPLEINTLFGKSKHHFECGLGYTPVLFLGETNEKYSDIILFRVGYRYQKPNGGLLLRIGFTPGISNVDINSDKYSFGPWFGISIGKSF
jgi:hypothetical protein